MTAGELAVALNDEECAPVTIRAELSRLRGAVGHIELGSRPYRVLSRVDSDVSVLRELLATGRLRQAVAVYRGAILPQSTAPAVARLRDETHMHLRSSLLASDDADALLSFADTEHGRDDHDVWARTLQVLPARSPRRAQVVAQLNRLAAELA